MSFQDWLDRSPPVTTTKRFIMFVRVLWFCFGALLTLAVTISDGAQAAPSVPVASQQAPASTSLKLGDRGYPVTVVQMKLASYKFTIVVDGDFGTQTDAVVRKWQEMNGLRADGMVGPRTLASLGLSEASLTPRVPVVKAKKTPTPTPPRAPTAPVEGCYSGLLASYGMPTEFFVPVIKRESGCDPTAHNGRGEDDSYGLLQINTKGGLWEELQWRCNLTSKDQLFDAETNIACGARLYDAYGKRPWS